MKYRIEVWEQMNYIRPNYFELLACMGIIFIGVNVFGCSPKVKEDMRDREPLPSTLPSTRVASPSTQAIAAAPPPPYDKIKVGMSVYEVIGLLGAPNSDTGSGLWILRYNIPPDGELIVEASQVVL